MDRATASVSIDGLVDIVAVDGPSGTGKSTVARALAERLGFGFLDTGAMYRAATVAVLQDAVPLDSPDAITAVVGRSRIDVSIRPDERQTMLNGADVSGPIRGQAVTQAVSAVSAVPEVRALLVDQQRRLAAGGQVVVEGRDIGSVVFPNAVLKVFLTADAAERARRRAQQVGEAHGSVHDIARDLQRRDDFDGSRASSPLTRPSGAVDVDTTSSSIDEVVDRLVDLYAKSCITAGWKAGT